MKSFLQKFFPKHNSILFFSTLILISASVLLTTGSVLAGNSVITDMADREVKVPEDPQRIVALGAGMMRKVAYFKATDKIVGVEDSEKDPEDFNSPYQLANPELLDKPMIGPQHGGDAELIAGVEPDLILFSGDAGEAQKLNHRLNIPVVQFEFGDIFNQRQILYEALELMGEVLNKSERSRELRKFIATTISDLNSRTENIPADERPVVYAGGMSYRGAHGFNSVRYPFPPFEFINASDVTEEYLDYENMTHVELSRELLLDWDPKTIFVDLGNYHLVREDFVKHREYSALSAAQNNDIYGLMPYASYHVNFASVLANSYYIGSIVYPEKFADIEPTDKADEIYKTMLGEPVYQNMADEHGSFGTVDL